MGKLRGKPEVYENIVLSMKRRLNAVIDSDVICRRTFDMSSRLGYNSSLNKYMYHFLDFEIIKYRMRDATCVI